MLIVNRQDGGWDSCVTKSKMATIIELYIYIYIDHALPGSVGHPGTIHDGHPPIGCHLWLCRGPWNVHGVWKPMTWRGRAVGQGSPSCGQLVVFYFSCWSNMEPHTLIMVGERLVTGWLWLLIGCWMAMLVGCGWWNGHWELTNTTLGKGGLLSMFASGQWRACEADCFFE